MSAWLPGEHGDENARIRSIYAGAADETLSSRASHAASVSAIAARASGSRVRCSSISVNRRWPAPRIDWHGGRPLSRAVRKAASCFEMKPNRG